MDYDTFRFYIFKRNHFW